jgi:hypothetical protein
MKKYTEIMSEMDCTVLYLEGLENNRLMIEVTPMELGTHSARVFLDATGIKKLKKVLADIETPEHPKTLIEVLCQPTDNPKVELAHKRLVAKLNDTITKEVPFTDALGVEFGCNDE